MDNQVSIEVFGTRDLAGCYSGGWGPARSQEETTWEVAEILSAMYGNLVKTSFRDIKETTDTVVKELVEKEGAPLPIIKMNGKVRVTGHLFVPILVSEIDSILAADKETTS